MTSQAFPGKAGRINLTKKRVSKKNTRKKARTMRVLFSKCGRHVRFRPYPWSESSDAARDSCRFRFRIRGSKTNLLYQIMMGCQSMKSCVRKRKNTIPSFFRVPCSPSGTRIWKERCHLRSTADPARQGPRDQQHFSAAD